MSNKNRQSDETAGPSQLAKDHARRLIKAEAEGKTVDRSGIVERARAIVDLADIHNNRVAAYRSIKDQPKKSMQGDRLLDSWSKILFDIANLETQLSDRGYSEHDADLRRLHDACLNFGVDTWHMQFDLSAFEKSIRELEEDLGIPAEEQTCSSTSVSRAKNNKKGTVNQRMLEKIQKDPDSMGWNSREWAEHLKCAKSTVVVTDTWRNLEQSRMKTKAERANDRRRRVLKPL